MIGTVNFSNEDGFTFISRERLPKGMFTCYTHSGRKVLCRVKHAEPLNRYPQEFLMDMDIEADAISGFYGLDPEDFKYYSYSASVIGYFDAAMGEFINPRTNPACGQKIECAAGDVLKDISKTERGAVGSAFIGTVLGEEKEIVLSVRDVASQHL